MKLLTSQSFHDASECLREIQGNLTFAEETILFLAITRLRGTNLSLAPVAFKISEILTILEIGNRNGVEFALGRLADHLMKGLPLRDSDTCATTRVSLCERIHWDLRAGILELEFSDHLASVLLTLRDAPSTRD